MKVLSIGNSCRPYVGFKVKRRRKQRRSCDDQGDIQEKKRFEIDEVKVQVQDGHLEETICLKLAILSLEADM